MTFSGYGTRIALIENPGVKEVDEGQLILIDNHYSTPLYSLKQPYEVPGRTDSFFIHFKSDIETILELHLSDEILKEVNLPIAEEAIFYQIPIESGDFVRKFRIRSTENKGNRNFMLLASGVEESINGLSVCNRNGSTVTVIGQGLEILNSHTYMFEDLSVKAQKSFSQVRLTLGYDFTEERAGKELIDQELVLFSGKNEKSFGILPRNGGADIYFYSNSLGFIPTGMRIKKTDTDFKINKIDISSFSTMATVDFSPVTADIGTMLRFNKSAWRRSNFEIFS